MSAIDQVLKKQINKYLENMDEYQLRLVASFIKSLFEFTD